MLSGLIPPLCTPLTADGEVDAASLERLITTVLEAGASGVFVLGSSGEAAYLPDNARRLVVDITASFVGQQVPVLVGALDTATERVIQQGSDLTRRGVAALVVTAPFYANPSDAEVARHFREVAGRAGVPVLAYDTPGNVGRRIPVDVTIDLLQEGVIAGLKDSSGSLTEFRLVIDALGPDRSVSLLTGADILADLALDLGADGFIPGLANVRPAIFADLAEAHRLGDRSRVAALQTAATSLSAIFSIGQKFGLGRHASELGAIKHLLVRGGVITSAAVSSPMSAYPALAAAEVDSVVEQLDRRLAERLAALGRRAPGRTTTITRDVSPRSVL